MLAFFSTIVTNLHLINVLYYGTCTASTNSILKKKLLQNREKRITPTTEHAKQPESKISGNRTKRSRSSNNNATSLRMKQT